MNLRDEVETVLYFQINLKEALSLPINTEDMLYPGVAAVTPDMLEQAKKKILEISNEDLLATSPFWHHYIEGKNKELHEQIIDKYQTLLVDLEDYFKLDNEKEAFLEDHLDLTNFLKEAANQKIQQEYIALVNFLDAERRREITKKFQDDEKGKATVFL